MYIKYIYIYVILYTLLDFDDFEGGKGGGGANHPGMKLWYRGEEVLIKKVFH